MVFTYTALGLADRFREFYENFLNRLAASGVSIEHKSYTPSRVTLKLKTTEEEGDVEITPRGNDIVVSFKVAKLAEKRKLETLRAGVDILSRALSGDIIGATLEAAEESIESALSGASGYLASTIANAAKDTAEELRSKAPGGVPEEAREFQEEAERVRSRLISLGEELEIAKMENKDVRGAELRYERARKLYEDAVADAQRGDYSLAKSKLEAASKLLEKAEEIVWRA